MSEGEVVDPYSMKDANLTILRAVLVVPTLIGCLMMCISIPQVPLINHEVAVMFITAAIPCCCLQIYISLTRIEGEENIHGGGWLFATRGDQQWFVQNLFGWLGCLGHCLMINRYSGFIAATVIFIVALVLWPLLWATQRKRELMLHGKRPGCQLERESLTAEVATTLATMFFSYYNVFQAWGCVGTEYTTPDECASSVFSQLLVISEVSLLSIMEFITVRGGFYTQFDIMTFQVETIDLVIMGLCGLTILIGVFVFSTSNVDSLYYHIGGQGLTTMGTAIFGAHSGLWLIIAFLCRVSDHWRQIGDDEGNVSVGMRNDDEGQQEEVMLVPTTAA